MSQEEDPVLVQIDEISQTLKSLVDLWFRVLTDTELLIQAMLARLEARQQAGTTGAAGQTHTRTDRQETVTLSSRRTPAPEDARHESTHSTSSRTSMKGIENLEQLLDEDAASSSGRSSRRTTRGSHTVNQQQERSFASAGGSQPQSPQAAGHRESGSVQTEEMQVVAVQETGSDGTASPPGVRTRRRDVKAKTVVRGNIAKLEASIKQLEEVKSRMCTEVVCKTKGNATYDAAAVEIDETVKKLESVGLVPGSTE